MVSNEKKGFSFKQQHISHIFRVTKHVFVENVMTMKAEEQKP